MTRPRTAARRAAAALCALGTALAGAVVAGPAAGARPGPDRTPLFEQVGEFPVYLNSSVDEETSAEIIAATADGRTGVYTDSPGERIGFVDLRRLDAPAPAGTLAVPGEPTSVDVVGRLALVAVDTSESAADPSGRLVVVDVRTRAVVAEHELGGQPDAVDVTPDGRYAAIAIENQRDEDVADGELPQPPPGFLVVVDLRGAPSSWPVRRVDLTGLADVAPEDPEPEYVSTRGDRAVVTLQENNHVVVVDLRRGAVVTDFSAGTGVAEGVDTVEDGVVRLDGRVEAPREPDGVAWLDDRYVGTADEGDYVGGSRTWTVFDTRTGEAVFSSGGELERLAAELGRYPEDRAENRGVEPENIAVAQYGRTRYAFIALERADAVAVYRVDDPRRPELVQGLPTGTGPEGLLPLPRRRALVVANEVDDPEGVRSTVTTYRLTRR